MKISQEDFDSWRDNPITQALMGHLARMSDAFKKEFVEASFSSEQINERTLMLLLVAVRSKSQILQEIIELGLEDIETDDDHQTSRAARAARRRA